MQVAGTRGDHDGEVVGAEGAEGAEGVAEEVVLTSAAVAAAAAAAAAVIIMKIRRSFNAHTYVQ